MADELDDLELVRMLRRGYEGSGYLDQTQSNAACRIEILATSLNRLVRLYARRGGENDSFLPRSEQEPEMAEAMIILGVGF